MSRLVIVPDSLSAAINAEIDRELSGREIPTCERQDIYQSILSYFDEHGHVPSITLNRAVISE